MKEENHVPYEVETQILASLVSREEQSILDQASSILERLASTHDALTSPATVKQWLQVELRAEPSEVFCVLWLDNRHRPITLQRLFNGTIDGASVHPRAVVRAALQHNAAACILAHNHPSGVANPSRADIQITSRLKESLALVDVRVLDHIVIGDTAVSMAERGDI